MRLRLTSGTVGTEKGVASNFPDTDILSRIGNTPLLRLAKVSTECPGVSLFAKAEWFNPGGSVKDRPALNMILEGERTGQLTRSKILLDATSGNTGIAYAMIGAVRGYRVRLVVPENIGYERKRILEAYGAELVFSDAREGSDGAITLARKMAANDPTLYFYPDQYSNPANWQSHYKTTAMEIYLQTQKHVTHFVAGMGTSGTFTGIGRRLKALIPGVRVIAMQPESPMHGLEGMKHYASSIIPAIYDSGLADRFVEVSTEEAQLMVKRLACEEGLLAGISAGGNVAAALKVGKGLKSGTVVTVLCDGGMKYMSERFWDNGKRNH